MIKFIHKKHVSEGKEAGIVIYYNVSDIFLGTALLILVVFFIHDYLSHSLTPGNNDGVYMNQAYNNQLKTNPLRLKP